MAHVHSILDWGTRTVSVCSVLHTTLPPWEKLNNHPRLQAVYKMFIYVIGYVAVSGRSLLYASISTQEGAKPSCAALNPGSPSNLVNIAEKKELKDERL